MKILKTSQRVQMWLCGFPPDDSVSKWKRCAFVLFTSWIILVHSTSIIAGVTFIYRNVSINLEATLFSLYHTMGSTSMLYQSIVTVLSSRGIAAIYQGLSKIYNESEYATKVKNNELQIINIKIFSCQFTTFLSIFIFKFIQFRQKQRFVSHFDEHKRQVWMGLVQNLHQIYSRRLYHQQHH